MYLKSKQLTLFLFFVQGIGVIFSSVFSAAYFFALPSINVLSEEPVFKLLLSIFGGLFVILVLVSLVFSAIVNQKD